MKNNSSCYFKKQLIYLFWWLINLFSEWSFFKIEGGEELKGLIILFLINFFYCLCRSVNLMLQFGNMLLFNWEIYPWLYHCPNVGYAVYIRKCISCIKNLTFFICFLSWNAPNLICHLVGLWDVFSDMHLYRNVLPLKISFFFFTIKERSILVFLNFLVHN